MNAALARSSLRRLLLHQPVELLFNVTNRCTLKCHMCMNHSPDAERLATPGLHAGASDLTEKFFTDVLRTYPHSLRVSLAGVGEPLLNPEIFAMISGAKRLRKRVSVITNGTMLEESAGPLIDSGPDLISISLNAADAEGFQKACNAPEVTFTKVLEGIERLIELRASTSAQVEIGLSCVIKRSQLDLLQPMIELASRLKVDFLEFHNLIPSTLPDCGPAQCLYADDPEVRALLDAIDLPAAPRIGLPVPLRKGAAGGGCHSFYKTLYIDGDGAVSGCPRLFPPMTANGLATDPSTWKNDYFRHWRGALESGDRQPADECRYCVDFAPGGLG